MKKNYLLFTTIIAIVILVGSAFKTVLSSNGKPGKTGSPGETTCSSCHGTTGTGSIAINLPASLQGGAPYALGQTYTISVTVSQNACNLFGFGFEALNANGANGGNLTPGSGTQDLIINISGNSRKNIVHAAGSGASANSHTFSFTWTAPITNDGNITFYTAGIAANGDGQSGAADKTYSTSIVIPAPQSSVGITEKISFENNILIFPNPSSDKIELNYSLIKNSIVKASIFNLEGKIIELFNEHESAGEKIHEIELDKLNLASGVYFISLSVDGNKALTKKLAINQK